MKLKVSILIVVLMFLVSCTEKSEVVGQKEEINSGGNGKAISATENGSPESCEYNERAPKIGAMRIKVGDSLAEIVANSEIESLDLGATFEDAISVYTAIGETVKVVLDTGYGEITIDKTIALEFSITSKMHATEDRDRTLAERFHGGVTISTYPKYYRLSCLESVVDQYHKKFSLMGFERVHLDNEKSWDEFNYLFSDSHSMDRLISYYFSSWKRDGTGLQIAIAQWRSPNPSNKAVPARLYNINIRMSNANEDWAWK